MSNPYIREAKPPPPPPTSTGPCVYAVEAGPGGHGTEASFQGASFRGLNWDRRQARTLSARGSKRAKHRTCWAQGGGAETRTLLWSQITPDARVHAWASHDGQRKHTLLGRKVTVRLYLERQLWQDAGRDGIPDQG